MKKNQFKHTTYVSNRSRIIDSVAKTILAEQQELNSEESSKLSIKEENLVFNELREGEQGLVELICMVGKDSYCYDPMSSKWYRWNGNNWEEDINQTVFRVLRRHLARRLKKIIKKIEKLPDSDDKTNKLALLRWGNNKLEFIEITNRLVKMSTKGIYSPTDKKTNDLVAGLGINGTEWDSHPHLIGFQNGVLNMTTGNFRKGQPEDFIKDVIPLEWKGWNVPAPYFMKFLESSLPKDVNKPELGGDNEVISCLQRSLGHSFGGTIKEHRLVVLSGEKGRNGKTTLMEAIKYAFGGNYVHAANSALLTEPPFTRSSAAPSPDKMALRNKRIVYASEVKRGATMDCEQVKLLTGSDSITARNCFDKHDVTFKPTHQLILIANEIPKIAFDDSAMWYRLLIFRFQLSFVDNPTESFERKADPDLLEKLKKEALGIIVWVLNGYREYRKQGINPPESVKASVREFQIKNDVLGLFISEVLIKDQNSSIVSSRLYGAYKKWAVDSGFSQNDIMSSTRFGTMAKERIACVKSSSGMVYKGYKLPNQNK